MVILERIKHQIAKKRGPFLSDYLAPGLVCFLQVAHRDEALDQLIQRLDEHGKLPDREIFFDAILQREKIVSTGIGMGLAIPHAKFDSYTEFFIAIGIQRGEGIEWDALDGAPVRLIFLIGGPAKQQGEYLQILSKLTSVIKDEKARAALLSAETPEDVLKLFEDC